MALVAANVLSRPEDMATRLIRWASLFPPVDVEGAARRLGIDIEELPLSNAVSGMLIREGPKQWLIVVNNRYRDARRRRFTIAHELGHWCLHRQRLRRSSLELAGELEGEANEFAGALLIPTEHLYMTTHFDAERIFGVTGAALWTRIEKRYR